MDDLLPNVSSRHFLEGYEFAGNLHSNMSRGFIAATSYNSSPTKTTRPHILDDMKRGVSSKVAVGVADGASTHPTS